MSANYKTRQMQIWESDFGKDYIGRNPQSIEEENKGYIREYGISRREMNETFLRTLDRSLRILEAGANIGLQLEVLRSMGFTNLSGVEINVEAVARAKHIHPHLEVIEGSIFDIPFPNDSFDLVFTSGVLIHIAPQDLPHAMKELWRVSSRFIWGFEYYSPAQVQIIYRGDRGLLWKDDFCSRFLKEFPRLKLVKEKKFPIANSKNVSQMFLLEKIKS